MINFSRTIIVFFTLLISYINSGFLLSNNTQESIFNLETSYPSPDRYSIQNIFLCPVSDLNIKNNLVPSKTEKLLQKIKIQWGIRSGTLINKNPQYHLKPDNQDPSLIADIFGPPDISFPFNYFW